METSIVWDKRQNKFCEVQKSSGSKLFFMLKRQQEESEKQEKLLKSKGVCPHCMCYRPMSGICDCER